MGLFGFVGDLFKKKVKVPEFKPVSATDIEKKAISDYESNLPAATSFAEKLNQSNQSALDRQIGAKIPGFSNIESKVASNIASQVAGEIPEDVAQAIQRSTAARALEGGFGGSGAARNLTARDLGLTSLQLSQQGLGNAMNWLQSTRQNRMAPMTSPSSLFISPEQRLGLAVSERDKAMNRDYLSSQLKASQSWQNSLGNAIGGIDTVIGGALGSFGGAIGASAGYNLGNKWFGGGMPSGGGFNPGAGGNAGYY